MIKRLFTWYCDRAMHTDVTTLSCQTPIRFLKVS